MSELQIDILLLFIISFSAVVLLYIFYIEMKRVRHISIIKEIISSKYDVTNDLLTEKKEKIENQNILTKIEDLMVRAGMNFSVYIFIIIFIIFVSVVGGSFSLFLRHWSGYVIGIPFAFFTFNMILQGIITRRRKEFNRLLAVAIAVLVKMMKNGIGFEQALTKSVEVSSSAMFKELFNGFFKEKNAIGEEEAFNHLNKKVHSKELAIFALAIKIGRASGGQFSNTLEKVEKTINYRKKMQEKVDVVTREGSFGSYIVVGIAVFLYFSLNGNFDGKLHTYFMESEWGRFQLLGIALWVFTGMIINKMITRVDK